MIWLEEEEEELFNKKYFFTIKKKIKRKYFPYVTSSQSKNYIFFV